MALRAPASAPAPRVTRSASASDLSRLAPDQQNAVRISTVSDVAESPRRTRSDSCGAAAADDDMRCKRAPSTLASGFYSVGVGAPRATAATAAVSTSLSPSLRFLEHLTMEISNTVGSSHSRSKKQFAMTVHHNKTKASWRHCHSYDDYFELQQRLLALMEQGHFCMAECPWLYTFLRRSFPKPPSLFSFGLIGSDKACDERRFALLRTLGTLQSVLLNPNNHSCEVLTNAVATELVAFLYGETLEQVNSKHAAAPSPVIVRPWEVASPVAGAVRGFSASLDRLSTVDVEDTTDDSSVEATSSSEAAEPVVCCSMCALQEQHPEEEILADWHAHELKHTPTMVRSRTSSSDTMVLSQFAETPTDFAYAETPGTPRSPPPPLIPENAILSPPRHYRAKEPRASKRFSLSASTVSMFYSLRQRVLSPSVQGSYAA